MHIHLNLLSLPPFFRLTFRPGQPTERWSNDDKSMRAKGGWVTRLATGTCADVYSEHEEYLVEMAPKLCTVDYDKGKKTCR